MTQPPQDPEQPDQPPHGAPPPPPYGSPTGPPPPSYGAPGGYPPPSPYGSPGAFPSGSEQGPPSKNMAIGALVSSILCCLPIGLVLGIVVLLRARDGRDHGKGLAIAAIVINVLVMIAAVVLLVVAVVIGSQVRTVSDLEPGDCISAEGLRGDSDGFETITEQECTEPHDAEVMGVFTLTAEDLETYPDSDYSELCDDAVSNDPDRYAVTQLGAVALLVIYDVDEPGEQVACLALAPEGGQLDEPLVD